MTLHFNSESFVVAAQAYLFGATEQPSDEQLEYAGQFGLWMGATYQTPQHVSNWRHAIERFEREGGADGWLDIKLADRADARAGERIFWQPGHAK